MATGSPRILTDSDLESVDMSVAIECMEDAMRQHADGTLKAPGRIATDLDAGQLVFTTGASVGPEPLVGFRCYDLKQLHSPARSEITVVLDGSDGSLHGLVIGPQLGAIRTGAIGGVAVKYLATRETSTLGLIGCGFQAETQLAAALAVRSFETIRVFSRDAGRRNDFAVRMGSRLNREITPVSSAQAAAENADVILCTTTSSTPALQAAWLKPGTHINNVGPKFHDAQELDRTIYANASRLVTDAPAQAAAYGERFILHGTPRESDLQTLSALVSTGSKPESAGDAASVFISLGLAGTEVLLAHRLLRESSCALG